MLMLLWNLLVLFSFFSYQCFVDCVGAVTCLCSCMILLFNLLAPFWLHTFVNSAPQWIFVPHVCTSRGKTYHLSRSLECASTHQSPCKMNGVWTGKKSQYIPVPQLRSPPLVGYILTIQMHLPINKSPSALPSYLQSFHSFCPGESQGNTESARLDCCTSFPNFPFLYSWRKTRDNRISHTLLLHVHFLLEKDKGTGN
jgi:hypothetical protein